MSLKQRIVANWYKPYSWMFLLIPFSALFRVIIFIRRWFLSKNTKKTARPVIIVGNITLGGAGKTPLVIHLARYFSAQGFRVGVISRGYGGTSATLTTKVTAQSDPKLVGEEPVLIAQETGCPVVVGKDRCAAMQALIEDMPAIQFVLSDDGLQHYSLPRDIEIAVVAGDKQFGNGFCLPAGPLREPLSRLEEVDYCVAKNKARAGEILFQYIPAMFHSMDKIKKSITYQEAVFEKVHAVAGIGDPNPFFNMLEEKGITVIKHIFPDHYAFDPQDLYFKEDFPIIMTHKDAIKCKDFSPPNAWYLTIQTVLPEDFENLLLKRVKGILYGKEII